MGFLQTLNQDHSGWTGLENLNTLHVYNLFSVPAGIRSDDPEQTLLAFLESTYAAAADTAKWDRAALERKSFGP